MRDAERLRALHQWVEILLLCGELGVKPALAQAKRRKHDPLGRETLEHAVQDQSRRR